MTDHEGNVQIDAETVINPKVAELGAPVWSKEEVPTINPAKPATKLAKELAGFVTEKTRETREKLKKNTV